MKAATLAFACATGFVFAVTTVQAHPTHTADSKAATAPAPSKCTIVVSGTPWRIRAHAAGGSLAGDTCTIAGVGMSCASAHAWVTKLTNRQDTGQIKGPSERSIVSVILTA